MMSHSGFTIVFGGPDFNPDDFLRSSFLEPHIVQRGDTLHDGRVAEESSVEFADVHNGTYPLDAAAEAFDLLRVNHAEFVRLSRFTGITIRTLNFFGDADSCSMELAPADIALLHELALCVSICVYGQFTGNG